MPRSDQYWHHDSPDNYFRRLQSYSSLGPSFSNPNSAHNPSAHTRTHTRTLTRSTNRTKSPELVRPTPRPPSSSLPKTPPNKKSLTTAGSPGFSGRSAQVIVQPPTPSDRYVDPPVASPDDGCPPPPPAHMRSESSVSLWPEQFREDASEVAPSDGVGLSEKSWIASLRSATLRHHNGLLELRSRGRWTKKRKIILGIEVLGVIIVLVVVAVVIYLKEKAYNYKPSTEHVTNTRAFATGGATHASINDVNDGIGKGQDVYTYYEGGPESFPSASQWVSFEAMWQSNLASISSSCSYLGYGSDNTASDTQYIYNAIQNRANASLVDHRYILAIILQESHGCVHVHSTTSSSGVKNPGLMQSHSGRSFSSSHAKLSIMAMVQDGTQGTASGAGLVQNLNRYGDAYSAARGYNSGYVPESGDLSEAAGATACYVSDVANRLTGWVNAKSTCPGDSD